MDNSSHSVGQVMYQWACDLFPICRSITGNGVRQTLDYFKKILPDLMIHEVPSGTQAFDWVVPDEWNIVDAYVADERGNRVIDFQKHNLHVVAYSAPIDKQMSFEELDKNLHSLANQPNAIPYITSYYKRQWGFCITDQDRQAMRQKPNAHYHVKIDSSLVSGHLTYGELIIPGKSTKEVLLSTYICHPSLANDNLSGPCVATALAQWIRDKLLDRRYTYRIVFLPETIGSILYLSKCSPEIRKNTIAGFVLTCMGDDNNYSYIPSRTGNTLSDKVANQVLSHQVSTYISYTFLDRGSDERQYCSPGIDLPICSVLRSKYGAYPEYHTSLDDLSYITPHGLQGGYDVVRKCIEVIEMNLVYRTTTLCEPQLGKRGLYPNLSTKEFTNNAYNMSNLIAYADGKNDLINIAEKIGVYAGDLDLIIKSLLDHKLLEVVD